MVKCCDCGMLSARRAADQELMCVPDTMRVNWEAGNPKLQVVGAFNIIPNEFENHPVCSAGVLSFERGDPVPEFQRDRECASFVRWVPALSPADHRAMLDRKFMLEREDTRDREMREREDARDAVARTQEAAREAAAQALEDVRNTKIEGLQRELHKQEMIIIGGIVTLAIIAGSIVGAMIEANWIAKPW